MNIRELAPKSITVKELEEKAPKYKGTLMEIYDLYKSGKVILVVNDSGLIEGINVKAVPGTSEEDRLIDEYAGQNFARAYGYAGMSIIEKALKMVRDGVVVTKNEDGTYTMDGKVVDENGNEVKPKQTAPTHTTSNTNVEDYPESVEVPNDLVTLTDVKKYLRRTYARCLARGCELDWNPNTHTVSGIEWGRKLSASELEAL